MPPAKPIVARVSLVFCASSHIVLEELLLRYRMPMNRHHFGEGAGKQTEFIIVVTSIIGVVTKASPLCFSTPAKRPVRIVVLLR